MRSACKQVMMTVDYIVNTLFLFLCCRSYNINKFHLIEKILAAFFFMYLQFVLCTVLLLLSFVIWGHMPLVYSTHSFPHLIKAGLELIGFMSWIHVPTRMKGWLAVGPIKHLSQIISISYFSHPFQGSELCPHHHHQHPQNNTQAA